MAKKKGKYVTVGIELPVRTARETINAQRWSNFTARVEKTLNKLHTDGCANVTIHAFENQGVMVIGQHVPQSTLEERMAALGVSALPIPLQGSSAEAAAVAQKMTGMMDALEARWVSGSSEEQQALLVQPVIAKFLQGDTPQEVRECIKALDYAITRHDQDHHHGPCETIDMMKALRTEMAKFIGTNTN